LHYGTIDGLAFTAEQTRDEERVQDLEEDVYAGSLFREFFVEILEVKQQRFNW
jgi:hypothetical protein